MSASRIMVAAIVGLIIAASLAAVSRVPWRPNPEDSAQLVLSWRGVSESRDLCREPTEEDLEGLPTHMRPDRICEEQLSAFRLTLSVDGEMLVDRTIEPSGARGDRPLYVFERRAITPGVHRLEVGFVPVPLGDSAPPSASTGITMNQTISVTPGHVALITRDGDRGGFIVRLASEPEGPAH